MFGKGANVPKRYVKLLAAYYDDKSAIVGRATNDTVVAYWVRGGALGFLGMSLITQEITGSVRPISAVREVDLGGTVVQDGLKEAVLPAVTLRFADGDDISIKVTDWPTDEFRDKARAFVQAVLCALR